MRPFGDIHILDIKLSIFEITIPLGNRSLAQTNALDFSALKLQSCRVGIKPLVIEFGLFVFDFNGFHSSKGTLLLVF